MFITTLLKTTMIKRQLPILVCCLSLVLAACGTGNTGSTGAGAAGAVLTGSGQGVTGAPGTIGMGAMNSAPVFAVTPMITGVASVGSTLSLAGTTTMDADFDAVAISYQWQANGVAIPAANGAVFTITPAQAHLTITAKLTINDGQGGIAKATTSGIVVANSAPVFTGVPKINGVAAVGSTLSLAGTTTSDADVDTVAISYQWQAGGAAIPGANGATFTITPTQAHLAITAKLTINDGQGAANSIAMVTVAGVAAVNSAPVFTGTPTISGAAVAGSTLSLAGTATSDADGDKVAISYQWQVGGTAIPAAIGATFVVTAAQASLSITAKLTINDGQGAVNSIVTTTTAPAIFTTNKITQFGITWTFSQNLIYGQTYGQFINGDYWVVGPVTITSVSPGWDGIRNGNVLDMGPSAGQGFYDGSTNGGIWAFDPALRSTFPLTIPGDTIHSLISTIGKPTPRAGGAQQALSTAAILTVVPTPPPADAFRPAYMGTKTIHRWTTVRTYLLPNLPVPVGATLPATTGMARPWLHNVPSVGMDVGGVGAMIHPDQNMPPYPRDSAYIVSNYAAAVLLNSSNRDVYAKQLIQLGIDLYGVHNAARQDAFMALGGYGNGWKFPIMFAGLMLNDGGMLAPRNLITNLYGGVVSSFGEDGDTYYGLSGRPMWGVDGTALGYIQPYWAHASFRDPAGITEVDAPPGFPTASWGGAYRLCCTSSSWVGEALSARILGLMTNWNRRAWFDYVDRWVSDKYTLGATNLYGSNFVKSVWVAYRAKY